MKEAGERIRTVCSVLEVRTAHVLYLGDHDPSGEDMVRDVSERLDEYANNGWLLKAADKIDPKTKEKYRGWVSEDPHDRARRLDPHIEVNVHKLALTMDQIEEYEPPPNPAKMSDSRAQKYVEEHGDESWEVDALPPAVLRDIIEAKLDELVDQELVDKIKAQEEKDKKLLTKAVESLRKKRN
jgi:hypothetical protein